MQDDERKWIDERVEKAIAHVQSGGKFDISVQVTIPNEWQKMTPLDIGYTAGIETTKLAENTAIRCPLSRRSDPGFTPSSTSIE